MCFETEHAGAVQSKGKQWKPPELYRYLSKLFCFSCFTSLPPPYVIYDGIIAPFPTENAQSQPAGFQSAEV